MKNIKTTVVAAALAAALGFAGSASANTYETFAEALGSVADGSSTPIGNSFAASMATNGFQDFFTFTISNFTGSEADVDVIANYTLTLPSEVTFSALKLFAGGIAPYGKTTESSLQNLGVALATGTQDLGATHNSWSLSAPVNGHTTYTLELDGTVVPHASTGAYGGTITIEAIPEPGEWAMMLAGLGIMGSMVRRRSRGV